jgi:hypothetical protein
MNRLGWNAVKLRKRALDGFICRSQCIPSWIMTVQTLTANTDIPIRMAQTRRMRSVVGRIMWAIWWGRSRSVNVSDASERKLGVIIPSGLSRR